MEPLITHDKEVLITLGRLSTLADYVSRLNLELELNNDEFMGTKAELVGTELRVYTDNNDDIDKIIKIADKIILNVILFSRRGKDAIVDIDTHINNLFLYPGIYDKGEKLYCVNIPIIDANYEEYYSYRYFDKLEEDFSSYYNLGTGIPDLGKDIIQIGNKRAFNINDVLTINKNAVISLKKLDKLDLSDKYSLSLLEDREVTLEIKTQSQSRQNVIIGNYEETCDNKLVIGKIVGDNLLFKYGRGKKFKYINLIRIY